MMQVLLSGLAIGAMYGLVGMGFAIAFYVTRVINFAEGQLLMVGVMVAAWIARTGVNRLGRGRSRDRCRRSRRRRDLPRRGPAGARVRSLQLRVAREHTRRRADSGKRRSFDLGADVALVPALLTGTSVHIGSATLTLQEAVTIVIAVAAAIAFELFRRKTLFGKLGMAIAHDPEMATAIGANTVLVATAAFALAGAFAGLGGVLIGPITYANPYLGDTYGIAGFVALMIGGTARPAAAMAGGLLLGILGEAANKLINTQASDWFPFCRGRRDPARAAGGAARPIVAPLRQAIRRTRAPAAGAPG